MSKKDYQVELPDSRNEVTPFIYRVEKEGTGISWGQAKVQLRKWFLVQARNLRNYSESEFKKQEAELLAQAAESVVSDKDKPKVESNASVVSN
jgi:hypothetical protein